MRAFKCAMRVMRAHLVFPIVYIMGLSFMGIFMAMSLSFGQADGQFQPERGDFAVVDRDRGPISDGISEALSAKGDRIEVADDRQAFQDAVAKGSVDYLLVVPKGYGDAFATAAREGAEPPSLDVVFSYYSAEGAYLDEAVGSYLSAVRTIAAAHPGATLSEVASDALEAIGHTAQTTILETGSSVTEVDRFLFYLQWSTYTLFAGITVCIGVLTATMGRTDVRRRSLISPLSFVSYNVQLGLACLTITVFAWLWSFGIGAATFPQAVANMTVPGIMWCALSMFGFCLIPLAVGFLLGQFGASITMSNAIGNICGMVVSFLGGAWMPLDLMSPAVLHVAQCMPGYWYNKACDLAAHLSGTPPLDAIVPILQSVGVLLLFTAVLLVIALLVARMRTRTSTAGGNAAAQTVIS